MMALNSAARETALRPEAGQPSPASTARRQETGAHGVQVPPAPKPFKEKRERKNTVFMFNLSYTGCKYLFCVIICNNNNNVQIQPIVFSSNYHTNILN